ncbi:MAG TPA: acyl-CoA desaturase [Chitinophagaceae bacterium]|nr:acyl-CoA desaturase [Chitinophagaceae bacterium]
MKFKSKNDSDFFSELIKKVDDYLETKGGNRFADNSIYIKGSFLIVLYVSSYILLLSGSLNTISSILFVMIMGLSGVMIVFNIVHDASHNVLFKNKSLNRAFAYFGDLMGMNSYIWNIRHNIQHHTFTNVAGGDVLLDSIPFIRVSPQQKKFPIHKFQAWYVPFLYMLYSIFWVFFIDFNMFKQKQMGNYKNIHHAWQEWTKLILFKSFYLFYMIIFPAWIIHIPFSTVLIGFLTYHIVAGILLSTVVVLGHCVEGAEYTAPDENGIIQNSFMQHEWNATYDCSTDSGVLHWITGGLNTHLAHHLFPKLCHCHYPAVTRIIKEHCAEYHINYPHYSLGDAIISHFNFLKIQANA